LVNQDALDTTRPNVLTSAVMVHRIGMRKCLPPGGALWSSGDETEWLVLVEAGALDVFLRDDPTQSPVATFRAGAWFAFDPGAACIARCEASLRTTVTMMQRGEVEGRARQGIRLCRVMPHRPPFNVKAFLGACYPARDRLRIAPAHEPPGQAE
jgi:hypothetical protein